MYMKSFKDFRRRSVEAVLVTVGASERTVDDDFILIHNKFDHLCSTMTNCYAVSNDTANHHKADLDHSIELSKLMYKIYSEQFDSEPTSQWPESRCALKNSALSRKYSDCCSSASILIGASCNATLREMGLEPFRAASSSMGPAVEETCKLRAKMVTDFDSYRRRLKSLESKKLSIEQSAGKEKAVAEVTADIAKYVAKVKSAEQAYIEFNEKTKGDIIMSRVSHDELLDNLLVTTIVCQAEMHQRLAAQLRQLVQLCPPDQVARIKCHIEENVSKGGPVIGDDGAVKAVSRPGTATGTRPGASNGTGKSSDSTAQPPTATLVTGTSSGHSEPSYSDAPYKQSVYVPPSCPPYPASLPPPYPLSTPESSVSTSHSSNYPAPSAPFAQESHRQFATESKEPFKQYEGQHSAEPVSTMPMVVALYDHEADADDELDFLAGDNVEVLEAGDGGWWKGRCKGRTGLFPVNYVQALT